MTMRLIGWAIIHSLWEGGVIALVTAALLTATRRAEANIRYAIGVAALSAMVIAPIMTAVSGASSPVSSTVREVSDDANPSPTMFIDALNVPAPSSAATVASPPSNENRLTNNRVRSATMTAKPYVESALPWLVAAWILGLMISSARLMGGLVRTRRITRNGSARASDVLVRRVKTLCDRLGITRAIETLESTTIDVPLVVGAIRPVIVVPVSLLTGLSPLQLDMLLAHELAHVRRHDYLVNLFQTAAETLLFYHPAARWISARIREERENCCDDIAIASCNADAGQYTATLLVLEESRSQGFGLAAAANGGSLLRRAQRLITGRNASVELGPMWLAGILTISAALFTGREAMAAIQSSYLPIATASSVKDSTTKHNRTPDMSQAAPSKVLRAPAGGSLADRWKWAERNAEGSPYWVGYLVAGDESGKERYYTSDIPIRIDGNVTLTGRMSLGDGDISNFTFWGVPLTPLVGAHSRNSTAIFLEVTNGITGRRISRVRMATFGLPVYFNRRPLIWLDSANDNESMDMLKSLIASTRDEETRRDLVAALGATRSADAVPMLIDILQSRDVAGVRREAAEWLGRKGDARAMSALSRAVRSDRSSDVRRESVDAFAEMSARSATDSLIEFAGISDDYDVRRTAVEGLGHRGDARAFNYLARLVNQAGDTQIRKDAIEALSDMDDPRGLNTVVELAQHDSNSDIRRDAVEQIARVEPASRAYDILQQIVRNDPSEDVRAEAVETIAEVHDAGSVPILAAIARNNRNERIQAEAVESLGEAADKERALPILVNIARTHPLSEARKKALDVVAGFGDEDVALNLLLESARKDTDEDVRRAAVEALGDPKDARALAALVSLIKGHDSIDVRQTALEVYAESAKTSDAVAMLKNIAANDASADMREKARDLLNDLANN